MLVYVLKLQIENAHEFKEVSLDGRLPHIVEFGDDRGICGVDIIKTEPFNPDSKEHAQLALDSWYRNVIPCEVLIPDFRRYLEEDLLPANADKVIQNIEWYK